MPETKNYIAQITLPSGSTYYIKDAEAWGRLDEIESSITGAMHYVGITTTEIADGSITATLTIDGETKTFTAADAGAVVIYGENEFVWNGSKWQEFGSTGSLKALAFKDRASGSVTAAGTVSQPEFTGTEGNVSVTGTPAGSVSIGTGEGTANYTPAGTVSQPGFTGTEGNVSVTGTPNGSVSISTGAGEANYTPAGSVSVNTTLNTTTVNSIDTVGTLPELTTTVSGETLTIGFSQGTLPTKTDNVSVATSINTNTASFSGTGVELTAAFTGASTTSTGTFTPAGSVSQPTFSGTGVELTGSFTGTATTSTGTFTPTGSVSQPTFSGSEVSVTVS